MDMSIVIPAFNESKKIHSDIKAAEKFLIDSHLSGEVIVVDDGSTDGTGALAEKISVSDGIICRVIRNPTNRGKGFSVRQGMVATNGAYAMFVDSGDCVDYKFALDGLALLKSGTCDIAHGSRRHPKSIITRHQSWLRRILSKIFKRFASFYLKLPTHFTDTQCGFKLYKGNVARDIYAECVSNGFTFDIEVILRALKKGYTIKEFPLSWKCDRDTRLLPVITSRKVLIEFFLMKKALAKQPS